MGSQVCRTQRFSCHLGVKTPGKLPGRFLRDRRDDPVLGVSYPDIDYFSDDTVFDHLPPLPDYRIRGVGIGHCKEEMSLFRDLFQIFGLGNGQGDRLVAQDVDIFFQKAFGNLIMAGIGRRNGDEIDAVIAGGFLVRHLLIICIDAVLRNLPGVRRLQVFVTMAGKTACAENSQIVHHGAVAVHIADIGAKSAANHTISYFFQENGLLSSKHAAQDILKTMLFFPVFVFIT